MPSKDTSLIRVKNDIKNALDEKRGNLSYTKYLGTLLFPDERKTQVIKQQQELEQMRKSILSKWLADLQDQARDPFTVREIAIIKYHDLFWNALFVERKWESSMIDAVLRIDVNLMRNQILSTAVQYVILLENAGLIDYDNIENHSFDYVVMGGKVEGTSQEIKKPASEVRQRV